MCARIEFPPHACTVFVSCLLREVGEETLGAVCYLLLAFVRTTTSDSAQREFGEVGGVVSARAQRSCPSCQLPLCDRKEVRGNTDHAVLPFEAPQSAKEVLPTIRLLETIVQILQHPGRSFNSENGLMVKPSCLDLVLEIIRAVEEAGREIGWVVGRVAG